MKVVSITVKGGTLIIIIIIQDELSIWVLNKSVDVQERREVLWK